MSALSLAGEIRAYVRGRVGADWKLSARERLELSASALEAAEELSDLLDQDCACPSRDKDIPAAVDALRRLRSALARTGGGS